MRTLPNQFSSFAAQGQEALTGAVRTWAEQVQRLAVPPNGVADLAALTALVDYSFDLAEQVLAAQRAAVKAILQAVASGAGALDLGSVPDETSHRG